MAGRVWPIHLYFRLLIEQNTATLEAILVGRFPFVWKNIFYGRKQNGTGLSTENFSESLECLSKVFLLSRFHWNDRKIIVYVPKALSYYSSAP